MHNPTVHHFGSAKRILRYVSGSLDFGVLYTKVSNVRLYKFLDSDWAGCLDDRRSTYRRLFSLGSGTISWSSKRQDVVALSSSSEVEYVIVTGASYQAI